MITSATAEFIYDYLTNTYRGIEIVDKRVDPFEIKKVYFNDPATVVLWADGTKTVVKCSEEDIYDEQTGLLMCIAKKAFGNKGAFNDILREWLPKDEEKFVISEVAQKLFDDFDNRANAFMNMFIGGKTDA